MSGHDRVVGTDRHQRHVERSVVGADLGEALGVAGVAAEVRPVRRPDDRPRRPQRGVAVQEAAGEVPGRCADQRELVDLGVLVPVEFDDALVGNAPITQVRADAERNDERGPLASSQREDRVDVEVVVMVVADDDRVQGRQRFQAAPAADASVPGR